MPVLASVMPLNSDVDAIRELSTKIGGDRFSSRDEDGDMELDFVEWSELMRQENVALTEKQLKDRFDKIDTDKNGKISLDEFYVDQNKRNLLSERRLAFAVAILLFAAAIIAPVAIYGTHEELPIYVTMTPSSRFALWSAAAKCFAYTVGLYWAALTGLTHFRNRAVSRTAVSRTPQ